LPPERPFPYSTPRLPVPGFVGLFVGEANRRIRKWRGEKRQGPRWKGSKGRTYDPRSGPANVIGSTVPKMWLPQGLLADYVPDSFSAMAVLLDFSLKPLCHVSTGLMHYPMCSVISVSTAIATAPVITHKLFVAHLLIFYSSPFLYY